MTENLPILPTKIFDNFLTNEEIAIINAEITATPKFIIKIKQIIKSCLRNFATFTNSMS